MAWNILKKRRENLEKDRAGEGLHLKKEYMVVEPSDEVEGKLAAGTLEDANETARASYVDDDDIALKAQGRLETIKHAQGDDPTKSGPFLGGGRKPGTSSGAFPFGSPGTKVSAQPSAEEQAKHHEKMRDYYKKLEKPGSEGVPQQGRRSLNEKERGELEPEIDVRSR